MKKLAIASLALLATGALGTAWAGQQLVQPVVINLAARNAIGVLASARKSADSVQYIGCQLSQGAGLPGSMYCSATDAAGTVVACVSSDPGLVHAVGAIHEDSSLLFYWDKAGMCTQLVIANYSSYETK